MLKSTRKREYFRYCRQLWLYIVDTNAYTDSFAAGERSLISSTIPKITVLGIERPIKLARGSPPGFSLKSWNLRLLRMARTVPGTDGHIQRFQKRGFTQRIDLPEHRLASACRNPADVCAVVRF